MGSKKKIAVIVGVIILVLLLAAGVVYALNGQTRKYNRQLIVARELLEQGEYERAIAAFAVAIAIDPNNFEAYGGKAEAVACKAGLEESIDNQLEGLLKAYLLYQDAMDVLESAGGIASTSRDNAKNLTDKQLEIQCRLENAVKDYVDELVTELNIEKIKELKEQYGEYVNVDFDAAIQKVEKIIQEEERIREEEQHKATEKFNNNLKAILEAPKVNGRCWLEYGSLEEMANEFEMKEDVKDVYCTVTYEEEKAMHTGFEVVYMTGSSTVGYDYDEMFLCKHFNWISDNKCYYSAAFRLENLNDGLPHVYAQTHPHIGNNPHGGFDEFVSSNNIKDFETLCDYLDIKNNNEQIVYETIYGPCEIECTEGSGIHQIGEPVSQIRIDFLENDMYDYVIFRETFDDRYDPVPIDIGMYINCYN